MKKLEINEDLIKILISTILFIVTLFIKNTSIKIVILSISYIIISYELYIKSIKNLLKGELFDENFLMIIATIGAFYIKEYPEAVLVILLFQIGEYLSDLAVDNSKKAITDLMDLRSDETNLIINKKVEIVKTETVKINDIFLVKPGEKVPLDGIIIEGKSSFDTSSLTGESVPKLLTVQEEVISGYVNNDSAIKVKATKTYTTSTANKIIELIETSTDKKAKTEKFITKFSKIYTPFVVLLAILIAIIPTLLGYEFNEWLYKALVFLVMSCPCALVISIPLAFFSGIGRASKEGILIKGSNELEQLTNINTIVFDKTGTITEGTFEVRKIEAIGLEKNELLEIVAHAEYYSNHPIAKAIVRNYSNKINENKISNFKEISGKGISADIAKAKILVGNIKLLEENNIKVKEIEEIGTVIYVAKNNKYIGSILISDKIKEESYSIVEKLNSIKINNIVMLSGDDKNIVSAVAKEIKIPTYQSHLLPQDKVQIVKDLSKNNFLAFVGDGINDAPVMKIANIGIAMGGIGSDATIEASDIVLMYDNLLKIPIAIKISKYTKNVMRFNICFALVTKLIVLLLGIFNVASIWMAVFADVGVTLLSILNTLTILKRKFDK